MNDDQKTANADGGEDPLKKEERADSSGSSDGPSSAEAELEKIKDEFAQQSVNIDNLKSQLQRALADYQNLEKRVAEGRAELASFVGANIIAKLLPTLDHLEKALAGAPEEEQKSGWFKGVRMAVVQYKQVLKEEGLQEVSTEGTFDPSLHEAVDTQEGENDQILSVAEKGYLLNGKILRPAKVVVGKSKAVK